MISVFCQLFCTGSLIYFVYVYGRLLQCTGRNITNFFLVREVPVVAALFPLPIGPYIFPIIPFGNATDWNFTQRTLL